MFCTKCGYKFKDNENVCPECGWVLRQTDDRPAPTTIIEPASAWGMAEDKGVSPAAPKRRKILPVIVIAVVFLAAAAVSAVLILGNSIGSKEPPTGTYYLNYTADELAEAEQDEYAFATGPAQNVQVMDLYVDDDTGELCKKTYSLSSGLESQYVCTYTDWSISGDSFTGSYDYIVCAADGTRVENSSGTDAFEISKDGSLSVGSEVWYRDPQSDVSGETLESGAASQLSICTIPADAVYLNGHFYCVLCLALKFDEAEAYCESLGGHLATVTSAEEDAFLFKYLNDMGSGGAYFGYTDEAAEGEWEWVTGEHSDYINWAATEPNGQNEYEDYCMYYYKYEDGGWNDGDFGKNSGESPQAFICEWDSLKAS